MQLTKQQIDKLKESGFRKDEISRFKNGNTAKLSKKRFAKMKLICFGKKENKPILITEAGIIVKQVRVKIINHFRSADFSLRPQKKDNKNE